MKRLCLALLLLNSTMTMADQFYLTAGITCDAKHSKLVVWFRGAWNGAGEAAIDALTRDGVDPQRLVTFEQDSEGKYKIIARSETKICRLGGSEYAVEFQPYLGPGFRPEGLCATRIGAGASVTLDGKPITWAGIDACTESGRVVTEIEIRPGRKPTFKWMKAEDFYGS